jgi:hypothetical protein
MNIIIWPLRQKMMQPVFLQQRPKWTGGLRIPSRPTLPWMFKDRPQAISFYRYDLPPLIDGFPTTGRPTTGRPSVVHRLMPPPVTWPLLSGITRDSTGVILGTCYVELLRTSDDLKFDGVTSDGQGNFSFKAARYGTNYYIVAYKQGSPDVAGTTVNTLTPT